MTKKTVIKTVAFCMSALLFVGAWPSTAFVYAATTGVYQERYDASISKFPESYQAGLKRVKDAYPNASFVYYDTGLDWENEVMTESGELRPGVNLIPSSSPSSWKSSDPRFYDAKTDTYKHSEPGWNQASKEIIEYYMDPRNFLNEDDVFQFLSLSYDNSQTVEGVQSIIAGTFMDGMTVTDTNGKSVGFAEALCAIGKETGVSPYMLACRLIQEQGGGHSPMISGNYGALAGYYNYFNIMASGSTSNAIITNGLTYAKNNGWNTPYKSILGGAYTLADEYVGAGKNSLYLQHFNVVVHDNVVSYNVYMANTQAPYHETQMMRTSLTDTQAPYTFIIPVYKNMPETPCEMPSGSGSSVHVVSGISIDGGETQINGFDPYTFKYNITTKNTNLIQLKIDKLSEETQIRINNQKIESSALTVEKGLLLNGGFNEITITAEAENGICRDYVLKIINDDGNPHFRFKNDEQKIENNTLCLSESMTVETLKNSLETMNCSVIVMTADGKSKDKNAYCGAGDQIVIKNKKSIVEQAMIIIKGDINADGKVTNEDALLLKDHLLETITLSQTQQSNADTDNDGDVTIKDLYQIKHMIAVVEKTKQPSFAENTTLVTLDPPEFLCTDFDAQLAFKAKADNYIATGLIQYEENKVMRTNGENSGNIPFIIIDGVLYTKETDKLALKAMVHSGLAKIKTNIADVYDYVGNKPIYDVQNTDLTIPIKNTEIQASVHYVENPDKNRNLVAEIKNISNMSIAKIDIAFGNYLNPVSEASTIVGLKPGSSKTIDLYLDKEMLGGQYETSIEVTYQDAMCVNKMVTIPISFEIADHKHDTWVSDDTNHSLSCKICGQEIIEPHSYEMIENNKYRCVICGYEKTYQTKISIKDIATIGESVSLDINVLDAKQKALNDQIKSVDWYINGNLIQNGKQSKFTTNTVGTHQINCIVHMKNGNIVCDTAYTQIVLPKEMKTTINQVSCNQITITGNKDAIYKVDQGKWEDGTAVKAGTHVLYIKQKDKAGIIPINLIVQHQVNNAVLSKATCQQNMILSETCATCNTKTEIEFQNTQSGHIYNKYEMLKEPTCTTGSLWEAQCVYACGEKQSKQREDAKAHRFTNYIQNLDGDCVSGGTQTATCDYGCGTTNTTPSNAESQGHTFVYHANNDATLEKSMTETGICEKCGFSNTRTIYNSRLKPLNEIELSIESATSRNLGLPAIYSATKDVEVVSETWTNSSGVVVDSSISLKTGETYRLDQLVLSIKNQKMCDKNVKITINNNVYCGTFDCSQNQLILTNVGSFAFKN